MKKYEYAILNYLKDKKTPIKSKKIANNTKISDHTTLKYLKKLERKKYVRKSKKGRSYAWKINQELCLHKFPDGHYKKEIDQGLVYVIYKCKKCGKVFSKCIGETYPPNEFGGFDY